LIILASEDIGLADPQALSIAVAAAQAVQMVGLPEGRLALGQAVIALALAPKSNAIIVAVDAAAADVRAGLGGPVPLHLRDGHAAGSAGLGHGVGYIYPHSVDDGVAAQQYAPQQLEGRRYYLPSRFGAELRYAEVMERVARHLRPDSAGPRHSNADDPLG
jgi:putative ATPase